MIKVEAHNRWLIYFTLALALWLQMLPMPPLWNWYRPEFLAIAIIYWALAVPDAMGITLAFGLGLLLDVAEGGLLGQHALGNTVIIYLCTLSYQRIRRYQLWQQSAWVFVLVGLFSVFGLWVHNITGTGTRSLQFLLPALTSAVVWSLAKPLLSNLRLRYRVS